MFKKVKKMTNKLLLLLVISFTVAAWGCSNAEKMNSKSNLVAESILSPRLLFDKKEIEKFMSDFPSQDYGIFEVPGVGKFYVDKEAPSLVKKFIKAGSPWEPETIELMTKYTVRGTTALDIGAHIGSLSLPLGRLVGYDGVVYAFEPQRKIYRELVKNLELNNIKNIIPLRFAVGSENAVIEMNSKINSVELWDGRIYECDGAVSVGTGGDKVELRTIDSFNFSNVSMMKIDVEGYELQVLQGAQSTIRTWHPTIILEITKNQNEVKAFFKQNGYSLKSADTRWMPNFIAIYRGFAAPLFSAFPTVGSYLDRIMYFIQRKLGHS